MALSLEGIAFIVTYRCNLACAHCFFDGRSTPRGTAEGEAMDPRLLEEALGSLDRPLRWVHFTGGEPLLNVSRLMRLVEKTRALHAADIGIASNGYWGIDAARARIIVDTARGHGVSGICLSIDAFHQVSVMALENAARAVAEAGMSRHSWLVVSLLPPDAAGAEERNQSSLALARSMSERTGLPVAETPIRSIGRAASLHEGSATTPQRIPDGPCRDLATCLGETGPFDPRMIWIDPYGNVMICYGLAIGNLRDASLASLLERYDPHANPVTRTLAEQGPVGLHHMAVEKGLSLEGPFLDECDLCFHSRRALRAEFPKTLLPDECYPTGS